MLRWVPRFNISILLVTTALIAVLMPAFISQLHHWLDAGGNAVIVSGDASPPSDEAICNALRQSGQRLPSISPAVYQAKITDYVDPPIRVPIIGQFHSRHRHYECGLQRKANPDSLPPVTIKRSELQWSHAGFGWFRSEREPVRPQRWGLTDDTLYFPSEASLKRLEEKAAHIPRDTKMAEREPARPRPWGMTDDTHYFPSEAKLKGLKENAAPPSPASHAGPASGEAKPPMVK